MPIANPEGNVPDKYLHETITRANIEYTRIMREGGTEKATAPLRQIRKDARQALREETGIPYADATVDVLSRALVLSLFHKKDKTTIEFIVTSLKSQSAVLKKESDDAESLLRRKSGEAESSGDPS